MLRGNRAFNAIDTVGKITGFNINKFKTVLFEAPALKRHEFIWKFSPKNMAEATTINNIVKRLKVDSAPPTLGNSGSAVFQYPHIFDIYFDPNFREMYGFKPSVIESIDVDYSAGNPHPSFYKDGFPESVTLNISFLEIEVWNRQDYTNWNSTNDPTRTITGENQNG
jgi:hypothetical protein